MCGSQSWIYLVISYSFGALNLFSVLTAQSGNTLLLFLVTFFPPSDRYCLFASRWCCSFSVWPVFTTCSHLKVTDSQLHEVIRHATAKARLKQQNAGRAFMARSPPSLAKQVGRCRGSIASHSLYIQQHPLSMRCYSPSLGGVRSLLVDPAASTVS